MTVEQVVEATQLQKEEIEKINKQIKVIAKSP